MFITYDDPNTVLVLKTMQIRMVISTNIYQSTLLHSFELFAASESKFQPTENVHVEYKGMEMMA